MFNSSQVIVMNKIESPHFVIRYVENVSSESTAKTLKKLSWTLLQFLLLVLDM